MTTAQFLAELRNREVPLDTMRAALTALQEVRAFITTLEADLRTQQVEEPSERVDEILNQLNILHRGTRDALDFSLDYGAKALTNLKRFATDIDTRIAMLPEEPPTP